MLEIPCFGWTKAHYIGGSFLHSFIFIFCLLILSYKSARLSVRCMCRMLSNPLRVFFYIEGSLSAWPRFLCAKYRWLEDCHQNRFLHVSFSSFQSVTLFK